MHASSSSYPEDPKAASTKAQDNQHEVNMSSFAACAPHVPRHVTTHGTALGSTITISPTFLLAKKKNADFTLNKATTDQKTVGKNPPFLRPSIPLMFYLSIMPFPPFVLLAILLHIVVALAPGPCGYPRASHVWRRCITNRGTKKMKKKLYIVYILYIL